MGRAGRIAEIFEYLVKLSAPPPLFTFFIDEFLEFFCVNKSGYGGISIASDYELIPIQKMRNESPRRKCGRSESVRVMHDYSSFSGQPRLSERAMKRPSDKF